MSSKNRRPARRQKAVTRKTGRAASEKDVQLQFAGAVQDFQAGNLQQAAQKADALIRQLPAHPDLFKLRGSIEFSQHNFTAAIAFFRKGLAVDPANRDLCDLLGTALSETGNHEEAVVLFRRALLGDPRNPGVWNNMGLALLQQGQLQEAEKAFRESLIYRPNDRSTRFNLATAWEKQEKFEDAQEAYRALIRDLPLAVDAYQALGECQMSARDWSGALQTAEDALQRGLEDAEIFTLKGYALGALLRFSEAEQALEKALEIEPGRPSAESALSILCFYQEKWLQGWRYYEARLRNPAFLNRPFTQERWAGEPLQGRKLLLWGEQGVGDEIMFGTMLADLLERGGDITFEMDSRLVPLFQRSFPTIDCVARSDPPAEVLMQSPFDFQLPSGSLGQYLRPSAPDFGSGAAYLRSDPEKTDQLRQTYKQPETRLVVGLAWHSSMDRGFSKSMPLAKLAPLFQVPGIRFVDLQYGDTVAERQAFTQATGHELLHDTRVDQMQSLDDFAAQITAMDLVISISNSTVHLSGALGVPTWVMLHAAPMQRWLMDRSDSPWYASVTLYRQRQEYDWDPVVEEVRGRLATFAR